MKTRVMAFLQRVLALCALFFVCLLSFACNYLEGDPIKGAKAYVFPGVAKLSLQTGGSYLLSWEQVPTDNVTYSIYMKSGEQDYNFTKPFDSTRELTFQTEVLAFSANTCFVVRFSKPRIRPDENTNELCTNSAKYQFPGVQGVTLNQTGGGGGGGGGYLVSWQEAPFAGVTYRVYEASAAGSQNYSSPVAIVSETNYSSRVFPLGRTACYVVRYLAEGIPPDSNTTEICAGGQSLGDFDGIVSATSTETGAVSLSWNLAPTHGVAGYAIYQGVGFNTLKQQVSSSENTVRFTGLTPDATYSFGVRAFDSVGREDANLKTIGVTILNNLAPTFAGLVSATKAGSDGVTLRWQEGTGGIVKYNIYKGVTATGVAAGLANVDLSAPVKTVTAPANSATVTGLGDELAHHFVVRAAVSGGAEDTNEVVKVAELPDNGAPVFAGIDSVAFAAGQVKIKWSAALGQTTTYRVYAVGGPTLGFAPSEIKLDVVSPALEAVLTGLLDNTTYTFGVRALDSHGAADTNTKTLSYSLGDLTPPSFQGFVSGTGLDENRISVVFNRSVEGDVARYSVRARRTGSGQAFSEYASVSQVSTGTITATLTGLQGNTSYDILVKGIDTAGNESTNATPLVRSTLDLTPPTYGGVSAVATDFTDAQNPKVKLTWAAPSGNDAVEYKIYYSTQSMAGLSLVKTASYPLDLGSGRIVRSPAGIVGSTPALQYSFAIGAAGTALAEGTTFYFSAHAIDAAGNEDTNAVQIAFAVPNVTPPVFSGLTSAAAGSGGPTSVLLTWPAATGASDYLVYQSTTAGVFSSTPTAVVAAPATTRLITGLADFTTYYYRVHARNVEGFEDTNTIDRSYFVPDATPPTFAGVSSVDANGTTQKLDVKFTAATDAQGVKEYYVYWRASGAPSFPGSPQKTVSQALACATTPCSVAVGTLDGLVANSTYDFRVDVADTNLPYPSGANINVTASVVSKTFPDYTPPSPPTIASITPSGATATSNTAPVVAGTSATGTTVKIYADGVEKGSQTINSGTAFSIAVNLSGLPSGDKVITAKAFNPLNVASNPASVGTYSLDVTAPTITTVSALSPVTIGGASSAAPSASFTFSSSETGSYVLTDGATTVTSGSTSSGANRTLTVTGTSLAAGDGLRTLLLTVTDTAGNAATLSPTVTLDTTAPAPPSNLFVVRDEDRSEMRFNWDNPTLVAGDTLMIRQNTAAPTASTAGSLLVGSLSNTTTSHTLSSLVSAPQGFSVFACDALGNCSGATSCASCKATLSNTVSFSGLVSENNLATLSYTASGATVRLGVSGTKTALEDWRVETQAGSPSGVTVAVPSSSPHSWDLSTANAGSSFAPWANLYFRVGLAEAAGNAVTLSRVRRWAQVPPGMVFVPKEDWPQGVTVAGSSPAIVESYAAEDIYDFAIDKFEGRLQGGVTESQDNLSVSASTTYPNSKTQILESVADTPDYGNWFDFKQACLNRTYASGYTGYVAAADLLTANKGNTTTPNPGRKFRLPTGVELTVAAYGTPDLGGAGNCNIDSRGTPANQSATDGNSTSSCASAFGARNLIANMWEWTDEWLTGVKRGAWEGAVGTTNEQSIFGNENLPTSDWWGNGNWDFRTGFRTTATTSTTLPDYFWTLFEDGSAEGGYGSSSAAGGWAPLRGGGWDYGAYAGRFALDVGHAPLYVGTSFGGRCSVSPPAPAPLVRRFGSESSGSAARLFWNVSGYEDSTNWRLGSAASKSDLDAWLGTASGTNVTVTTSFASCTTYTPSAGTLFTGKYCETPGSARYYKLCAQNPAIAGVQAAATCSNTLYFSPSGGEPTLTALLQTGGTRPTLQNDSVGSVAAFYWNASGGNSVVYRLANSADIDEISRWRGASVTFEAGSAVQTLTQSSVGTTTAAAAAGSARATCKNVFGTGQHYSPPAGLTDGTDYTDYACMDLSTLPKWAKRFFRLAVASTDGLSPATPAAWQLSNVNAAGHVPEGMVLVARELWPSLANGNAVDEFNATTVPVCVTQSSGYPTQDFSGAPTTNGQRLHNCRYDYAIDKYEPYLASGSYNNNEFSTAGKSASTNWTAAQGATTNSNNTTNAVLKSPKNHADALTRTPAASITWYAAKKACENRTADSTMTGFTGTGILTKPRLATGVEWTTAALETPDMSATFDNTFCQISTANTATVPGSTRAKCASRFGTYDQIGNLWEWTDELTFDKSNYERFYGTANVTNPFGALTLPGDGWVNTWTYISAFLSAVGGSASGDYYWSTVTNTTNPANGGYSGAGWAPLRGGDWSHGATAGRFALHVYFAPLGVLTSLGGRCSVSPP